MYLGKDTIANVGSCGGRVDSLSKMAIIYSREPLTSLTETQSLEVTITFWPSHSNTIRSICPLSEKMLEYVFSSSIMDLAIGLFRDFIICVLWIFV